MKILGILGLLLFVLFSSCKEKAPVPKPRSYLRSNLPGHEYSNVNIIHPCFSYNFDLGSYGSVGDFILNDKQPFFYFEPQKFTQFCSRQLIDIGPLNGRMELFSFEFQTKDSLKKLIDFSCDLVDEDKIMIDSDSYKRVIDSKNSVYGTMFYLMGNSAHNFRFHFTDSTSRFVLGFVRFNCRPNYDSLRPVIDYLKVDMDRMLSSFRWNK